MAAIRFFEPETSEYMKPADVYPDSLKSRLTAAEVADTSVRLHHGLPGKLQLFEIRLEPGLEISTHAHADDEIVAVMEGELHFGRRVCGPGSSFFIPGNTLYGFRAGPDGCRYLNFRAQADSTYFTKDDVVEDASLTMSPVGVRHIVLVGAMGAGKTTIGRRVAAALGRPFVDNDEELERTAGVTAAELAARDGIEALHRAEAAIVRGALRASGDAVIAAAASTIADAGVRDALRSDAWVAWLRADPESLAARLPGSAARPFADEDPQRLVREQARSRDALFAETADATFDTSGTTVDDVVARVLESAGQGRFGMRREDHRRPR